MSDRLALLLVLSSLIWPIMGCPASEPSEAKSREQPPAPAKPTAPAPSPTSGSVEEQAIQITLPTTPSGRSSGSGSDASVSDSFGPGSSLAECTTNCQARQLSEDNRATCRLLCQSHYARPTAGGDAKRVDAYVGCFDQCEGEASCRNRCASDVGSGDACGRRCLESFGRCLAPCESSADESGCSERCETSARACVGGC
jgi:hypothetical protein